MNFDFGNPNIEELDSIIEKSIDNLVALFPECYCNNDEDDEYSFHFELVL